MKARIPARSTTDWEVGPAGQNSACLPPSWKPVTPPGLSIASHIPLTQTRSFLTEQTLVHSEGVMSPQSAAETSLFPAPSCALEKEADYVESVS